MIKRIKALNKLEFESAHSKDAVYGKYKGMYVYIEQEYKDHPKDDPETQYKLFRGCNVEYSETEEQSEQGTYQYKNASIDIILYW